MQCLLACQVGGLSVCENQAGGQQQKALPCLKRPYLIGFRANYMLLCVLWIHRMFSCCQKD